MKLSMSNTSSTLGHHALEAKTEKGPLPALPHKERQLFNGRKTIRKCGILIQEKPNKGNRCLLPSSYFPFFQVRKKALWELASLCVPMLLSSKPQRGESQTQWSIELPQKLPAAANANVGLELFFFLRSCFFYF